MIRILFFAVYFVFASGEGIDLPSYIPKCSLSDPNLTECIKNSANKAIPFIAKGVYELEIPSISPFSVKEAPVMCENLHIILKDVYTDDLKNLRLLKASFDLKNGKGTMLATLNRLEVIAKNYTVISGEFLGIAATGHGIYNITIINSTFNLNADVATYKKGGETYMQIANTTMVSDCGRAYYYFGNLTSNSIPDMNAYIDQNWRKFSNQIKSALNMYMTAFIHLPLSIITSQIPLNKIFLP